MELGFSAGRATKAPSGLFCCFYKNNSHSCGASFQKHFVQSFCGWSAVMARRNDGVKSRVGNLSRRVFSSSTFFNAYDFRQADNVSTDFLSATLLFASLAFLHWQGSGWRVLENSYYWRRPTTFYRVAEWD
jgi:hypothetical protein